VSERMQSELAVFGELHESSGAVCAGSNPAEGTPPLRQRDQRFCPGHSLAGKASRTALMGPLGACCALLVGNQSARTPPQQEPIGRRSGDGSKTDPRSGSSCGSAADQTGRPPSWCAGHQFIVKGLLTSVSGPLVHRGEADDRPVARRARGRRRGSRACPRLEREPAHHRLAPFRRTPSLRRETASVHEHTPR
jgi:hypothetical protein